MSYKLEMAGKPAAYNNSGLEAGCNAAFQAAVPGGILPPT